MNVSIILCTRNRADSLDETLASLNSIVVPAGLRPEILVVDNGSTDATAAIAAKHAASKIPLRHIFEPGLGLSRARNAGLRQSSGEVLVFTDDDVTPSKEWLEHMVSPLLNRQYDALVGRIELAPRLLRPWMTGMHKLWLAAPGGFRDGRLELIGASMSFHRGVLDRVPRFDPELGAGALGFSDDGLFSWQLEEAGFRIGEAPEATAVHHPDAGRLLRSSWLSAARGRGRSDAYLLHHWLHGGLNCLWLRRLLLGAKLATRRRLEPASLDQEGAPLWEMSYVLHIEKYRQFALERKRARNYTQRGLKKL